MFIFEVEWDKRGREITHWDGHVSRQRGTLPSSSHRPKSKGLATLINLPLSLLITHRRQCQGHEFCPHHYLLISVFVQARSVGGNRWCVWQCVQHQAGSALVRVDRVDMCPDHKAKTCVQVTQLRLAGCSVRWKPQTVLEINQWILSFDATRNVKKRHLYFFWHSWTVSHSILNCSINIFEHWCCGWAYFQT